MRPAATRETKLWFWHLATAGVILVFLALHMLIMHMDTLLGVLSPAGGRAILWANVWARSKMLFFTFSYIVLLGSALYHGLYGLRTILLEISQIQAFQKALTYILCFVGASLFLLGTFAAIAAKVFTMGA